MYLKSVLNHILRNWFLCAVILATTSHLAYANGDDMSESKKRMEDFLKLSVYSVGCDKDCHNEFVIFACFDESKSTSLVEKMRFSLSGEKGILLAVDNIGKSIDGFYVMRIDLNKTFVAKSGILRIALDFREPMAGGPSGIEVNLTDILSTAVVDGDFLFEERNVAKICRASRALEAKHMSYLYQESLHH